MLNFEMEFWTIMNTLRTNTILNTLLAQHTIYIEKQMLERSPGEKTRKFEHSE